MKNTTKTSTTVIVKSKDNRKVSTIDKVASASVKNVTFEKALSSLEKALSSSENITKERAKALYAIKSKKMFDGCKDFKTFINEKFDGTIYGVKYNQANNLCNMYNFVWCDKVLNVYDSNKANLLVAYVKKDYAKVRALHDKGVINENMSKADITAILKKEFGDVDAKKSAKATKKVASGDSVAEATIIIDKLVKSYIKALENKGKTSEIEKYAKAWDIIKENLND